MIFVIFDPTACEEANIKVVSDQLSTVAADDADEIAASVSETLTDVEVYALNLGEGGIPMTLNLGQGIPEGATIKVVVVRSDTSEYVLIKNDDGETPVEFGQADSITEKLPTFAINKVVLLVSGITLGEEMITVKICACEEANIKVVTGQLSAVAADDAQEIADSVSETLTDVEVYTLNLGEGGIPMTLNLREGIPEGATIKVVVVRSDTSEYVLIKNDDGETPVEFGQADSITEKLPTFAINKVVLLVSGITLDEEMITVKICAPSTTTTEETTEESTTTLACEEANIKVVTGQLSAVAADDAQEIADSVSETLTDVEVYTLNLGEGGIPMTLNLRRHPGGCYHKAPSTTTTEETTEESTTTLACEEANIKVVTGQLSAVAADDAQEIADSVSETLTDVEVYTLNLGEDGIPMTLNLREGIPEGATIKVVVVRSDTSEYVLIKNDDGETPVEFGQADSITEKLPTFAKTKSYYWCLALLSTKK
ncbi:hypothetical protein BSL78_06069 [Apostichopus japonicus]|uniref:Uncharacterized protein n=1 Tax=Stichopus japonicus TaxID=307972 RepID=A0A2G8L9U1_STIJA|nr:hypothetical protein BSL78_06069 [Apostichopus japonicus]